MSLEPLTDERLAQLERVCRLALDDAGDGATACLPATDVLSAIVELRAARAQKLADAAGRLASPAPVSRRYVCLSGFSKWLRFCR